MAQYDLLFTQNIASAGLEFAEKYVNIAKGAILSSDANGAPTVLPPGDQGYMLVRDEATATGLKWQEVSAGHTQNTDTGTTSPSFQIDSGNSGPRTKNVSGAMHIRNAADSALADLVAANATFSKVTVSAAPVAGSDVTNKTYVDGLLAANDAMVYKGTLGSGGTITTLPTTYNTGWAYKVITAGTYAGKVCEYGDLLIAITSRTGTGNTDADWTVVQANLDGAVIGPATAVADNFALFDGATGKLIKDSGINAATFVPAAHVGSGGNAHADATTSVAGFMTAADKLKLDGIAAGAVNLSKATGAEINTGTDDAKYTTPKAIADSNVVKGPGSSADNRIPLFNSTSGKLLKDSGKTLADFMLAWTTAPANSGDVSMSPVNGNVAYNDNFLFLYKDGWKRSPLASVWS